LASLESHTIERFGQTAPQLSNMTNQFLNELAAGRWTEEIPPTGTHAALRACLSRTPLIQDLHAGISTGEVTDADLEALVDELMMQFRRGERFPFQLALAAIAVVLETRHTRFAKEYLRSLSQLRLDELRDAIGVARECVNRRDRAVTTLCKEFLVEDPLPRLQAPRIIDDSQLAIELRSNSTTEGRKCLALNIT
jgi:hypothetical protein